jgi:hypothetical protein
MSSESNQSDEAAPRELERERAGEAALRALGAELETPTRLRARIEAERDRPRHRLGWPALGAVAAGLAAVAIAVVVLPANDPTVTDTVELAALPAAEPAPEVEAGQPALLAANVEGVAFPNWESEFGWRATGSRSDELDGRATQTVVYEKRGSQVTYTIVAGEALDPPADAPVTTIDEVEFTTVNAGDLPGVTWLRDGHTCLLVGEGVDEETLVELAAWRGDGAVAF